MEKSVISKKEGICHSSFQEGNAIIQRIFSLGQLLERNVQQLDSKNLGPVSSVDLIIEKCPAAAFFLLDQRDKERIISEIRKMAQLNADRKAGRKPQEAFVFTGPGPSP